MKARFPCTRVLLYNSSGSARPAQTNTLDTDWAGERDGLKEAKYLARRRSVWENAHHWEARKAHYKGEPECPHAWAGVERARKFGGKLMVSERGQRTPEREVDLTLCRAQSEMQPEQNPCEGRSLQACDEFAWK